MEIINRRLFLTKCGLTFSILPNMLASEQSGNSCGLPLSNDRVFTNWDASVRGLARRIGIISIEKHNSDCILRVARYNREHDKYRLFLSMDNGQNWQLYDDSKVDIVGNINKVYAPMTISNNARTLFWRDFTNKEILVSADKGESWKQIALPSNIQEKIEYIVLMCVSPHNDNRIYARIKFTDKNDYEIYQINDYDKIFVKVTDVVSYFVESRANPKILIGLTRYVQKNEPQKIVVSKDGGVTWNKIKDNIATRHILYRNRFTNILSTIQKSSLDTEVVSTQTIAQIESDPVDPDTFYVVASTGVFATRNFGESFSLLPISDEYLGSIEEFAVNPVDGRHIFASVKTVDLYHSADRGCTWKKLIPPPS